MWSSLELAAGSYEIEEGGVATVIGEMEVQAVLGFHGIRKALPRHG